MTILCQRLREFKFTQPILQLTVSPTAAAAEDGVVRRSDGADRRAERRRAAVVGRQAVVGLRTGLGARVCLGARL